VKLKEIKERKLTHLQNIDHPPMEARIQGNVAGNTHRNRRRKHNKRKRNTKAKRKRRNVKLKNKENNFLEELRNLTLPSMERFKPFDNTDYNMNEIEKQVCAKGLKFVPAVKRVNLFQKMEDFERFARSLRLSVFFHDKDNAKDIPETKLPWTKSSTFEPPKNNARLEEYLLAVRNELFNPVNFNKIIDNMTPVQRASLNELRTWNSDETNPRLFRCQDKGARLVIDFKERYYEKITDYLEDKRTFREDNRDLTTENKLKVSQWADKWQNRKEIPLEVKEWVVPMNPRPAITHANVKTHKQNLPYRHIISGIGTATERLAIWTEYQLKKYACQHKAFLKNTTSFIKFIDDLNITIGPFDEQLSILTTRDIQNFYPSCTTNKCIEAISLILDTRAGDNLIDKDCILEAVKITMSCNNVEYHNRHFTQINGATIGGPNSASVTDIFGAIFIDKVIEEKCPYEVGEYARYRDDTVNINWNSSIEEQNNITNWLNEEIYKDRIIFTMDPLENNRTSINFLDIKATIVDGKIITETYSKSTDIHQYLNPTSCHPTHIFKGIPKSVIIRQRRNCTRMEEFIKCIREYKGYLLTSGYNEVEINNSFAPLINVNRKHLLVDNKDRHKKKTKETRRKHRFITNYEPVFTNIKKVLFKHQHILMSSHILKKVFPRGAKDFQIVEKRGAPNIKEYLASSRVNISIHEEENAGSYPCNKNCIYCPLLRNTQGKEFKSLKTGKSYKIRQHITCDSNDIVYLITCNRHIIQGIGYTSNIKSRISNYKNHHNHKVRTCGITEHYLDSDHDFDNDFEFQPIMKLMNTTFTWHEKACKLEEFELYWQQNMCTIEPHGMNKRIKADKAMKKIRERKQKK
jgi:hypothetical protein